MKTVARTIRPSHGLLKTKTSKPRRRARACGDPGRQCLLPGGALRPRQCYALHREKGGCTGGHGACNRWLRSVKAGCPKRCHHDGRQAPRPPERPLSSHASPARQLAPRPKTPARRVGYPSRHQGGEPPSVPPAGYEGCSKRSGRAGRMACVHPPSPPRGERTGWRQSRALKAYRPPPSPRPGGGAVRCHR